MLFNEPKLLKLIEYFAQKRVQIARFSALQRAEIAEIQPRCSSWRSTRYGFSALQRAEIAEIQTVPVRSALAPSFSALQRAEIAEIQSVFERGATLYVFQCSSTSRNC